MNVSKLHLYSVGIVATNKVMSSNQVMVTPLEVMPMLDGEITSNPTLQSVQGQDAQGRNYTVQAIHDISLVADWYNESGDNRSTAPDVRRGERVKIWRYADADKFYWTPMGMDNQLRKLETVRHTYSGTQDESATELDENNSYYTEVSTHQGTITVSMSKANGEVVKYHVQLDGKNGLMHVQDDIGNSIVMDSQNNRIAATNGAGTQVRLDQQNVSMYAKDTIALNALKTFSLETQDLQIKTQTMELTVTDKFTANITNELDVTCPQTNLTGNLKMTGNLEVDGTSSLKGLVTAQQGLNSPSVPIHGPSETLS